MPVATAADIALGTRQQLVRKVQDAGIKARYPNQARDAQLDVPDGYFDNVADADAALATRAALLGVERRRFAVELDGISWFDPLTFGGIRIVDSEQAVDLVCLMARWEVDCEAERTREELFG